MTLFTSEDYLARYTEETEISQDKIEEASDMIFAQISPSIRNKEWNADTVPLEIKRACLIQAKFLKDYEIPDIDYKSEVNVGEMSADLSSKYSTRALTILANAGYEFRGSQPNFGLNLTWGGE